MGSRTNTAASVKVDGLDELRRELKRLDTDDDWIAELKDVNFEVADHVVDAAQRRAFDPLTRKASRSLKAGRQAARGVVSGGGARTPFFAGAEFGSLRFPQFHPWRGNDRSAGYFLFPAIRDEADEIVEMYGDAIDRITRRAFPS